jgi:diguanylate cyclase (GGDEF)-like protein
VAKRLAQSVRAYDTVGRLGGEEFLVVLPDCDSCTGVVVAERFRLAIAGSPVRGDDQRIPMTASFGVASTDQNESASAADLIRAADAAMYRAKFAGRDRVLRAERSDWRGSPVPESSTESVATLPDTQPEPATRSTG